MINKISGLVYWGLDIPIYYFVEWVGKDPLSVCCSGNGLVAN